MSFTFCANAIISSYVSLDRADAGGRSYYVTITLINCLCAKSMHRSLRLIAENYSLDS